MVNHTQDFVAVKKYEILQYSLIPTQYISFETINKNIYCFQFYLLEGRGGGKSFIKHVNCYITVLHNVEKIKILFSFD